MIYSPVYEGSIVLFHANHPGRIELIDVCINIWFNICMEFAWDENKEKENIIKHGVSFFEAQEAFFDKNRVIARDLKHSTKLEQRYFCFGKASNNKILTVRFTIRQDKIRIIGAGYWREGRKKYYEENHQVPGSTD